MIFPQTVIERRLTERQQDVLDLLLSGPLQCQVKYGSGTSNSLGKIISQLRHTYGLAISTVRYEVPDQVSRPTPCFTYNLKDESRKRAQLLLEFSDIGL